MNFDISWIRPEQIVEFELTQLKDEKVDTSELVKKWEAIKSNSTDQKHLRNEAVLFINELEKHQNILPNESIEKFLETISRSNDQIITQLDSQTIHNKILGGWNGRAAGCLLGKPIEKYSREIIKEILTSNNSYPLENYITANGIPEELLKKYPWNRHDGKESLRENVECMTEDDDMNYAMLNLSILEKYGKDFTTIDVAETWLNVLPVMSTFTAERVAYYNLLKLMDIKSIPTFHNPYREWIGAMIRADIFGWISPGNPLQAAKLAFKDAALTHTRDGVYSEMFVSALIALSFTSNDTEEILTKAMNYIPKESRTYEAVEFGIDAANNNNSFEDILDVIHKKYSDLFWVHSVNNIALVAAALVYGNGDYEKSICFTVMAGLDTDSSGATVGAVIGTMNGFDELPKKWIKPLNNRIRSSMKGFDNSSFTKLAERTSKLAKN